MQITIPALSIPNRWQAGGTALELRIYAEQSFYALLNNLDTVFVLKDRIGGDHAYTTLSCPVTTGSVVIPAFEIYSTTDSPTNQSAKYTAILYDGNGNKIASHLVSFEVPVTLGATVSWSALAIHQKAKSRRFDARYLERTEVENLIAAQLAAVVRNPATTTTRGDIKVDTTPASPLSPTAVGINNPVFLDIQQTKFLNSYVSGSLAAAIVAIGNLIPTELVVSRETPVADDTIIPLNIYIKLEGNGSFKVDVGMTLTINSLAPVGNKRIFSGNGTVLLGKKAVSYINLAWYGGVDESVLKTAAIEQILLSLRANNGGTIYFPQGTWLTTGNHAACANLILAGSGKDTVIRATAGANGVFTHGAGIYNVSVRNLTIDGNAQTIAGYLCSAAYGESSAGRLRFENVIIKNCTYGFRIHDTLQTSWQMAAVSFDGNCDLRGNTYGVWCNSANNVVRCDAFFDVGANQWAGYFLASGQWTFTGEFGGSNYIGVYQIETQTIVAAAGITSGGVASMVVTAAGMTGSPATVSVNVDKTMTTDSLIATAFRAALGANPSVTSFFHIGGTGANLELIALDYAANDAAMNLSVNTGTAGGITDNASSANTIAGVADTTQAQGFYFNNAHGVINFLGTVDEGFRNFIVSDTSDIDSGINFEGASIQSAIKMNGTSQVKITECLIVDRAVRQSAGATVYYSSIGNIIPTQPYFSGANRTLSARRTHNFNGETASGGSQIELEINQSEARIFSQYSARFFHNDTNFFEPRTKARVEAMSSVDPAGGDDWAMFRTGRSTPTGEPLFYYDWKRIYATGRLAFTGNQTGFKGYDFDSDITSPGLTIGAFQTVTAIIVGTIGTGGNVRLVTTAAGMTGSPITTDFAVIAGDTADVVAKKGRTALNGVANITNFFVVRGTGESVMLVAKTSAANDATMNLAYLNLTASGLADDAVSDNTVAGVAGTRITSVQRGSLSINPASVAANAVSSQTFSMTGAVAGDSVVMTPPALTDGLLVMQTRISAADTVSITFYNTTGAAVDEGAGTWSYLIVRS